MKKVAIAFIFSILLAANVFAEEGTAKKPDTVFQKVADYSKEGYKSDVEPVKKVSFFQYMANWVNGKETENKDTSKNPSLFWKPSS